MLEEMPHFYILFAVRNTVLLE